MSFEHISEPLTRVIDAAAKAYADHQWFRYVTLENVGEYLAKGWEIADDMANCHHGNYSVLMQWKGDGEPK